MALGLEKFIRQPEDETKEVRPPPYDNVGHLINRHSYSNGLHKS